MTEKINKPIYKKWQFWIGIVLLVIIANIFLDDNGSENVGNYTEIEPIFIATWSLTDENYINDDLSFYSEFDERYIHEFRFGPVFLEAGTYNLVMNNTGIDGGMMVGINPHPHDRSFGFLSERSTLNNYGELIGFASFNASNSTALTNVATLVIVEDGYFHITASDSENYNGEFFESMSLYRID